MIDRTHSLPITRQCLLLDVARSTVYSPEPKGESPENLAIMEALDKLYIDRPTRGSRSMKDALEDQGIVAGRHKIRRLMTCSNAAPLPTSTLTPISWPFSLLIQWRVLFMDVVTSTIQALSSPRQVLDKLDLENRTRTRITSKQRQESRLFDPVALREAVINAIVHNDYSYDGVPKFELFSDRLEITTTGRIPQGLSREEFFDGYSVPRNKELMRIFRGLDMVEYLGSGIPRILRAYPRNCFRFTENFTRMVFLIPSQEIGGGREKTSEKTSEKIVRLMKEDRNITIALLNNITGVTTRSIERNIKTLQDRGRIRRVGGDHGGHWEVMEAT